MFIDTLFSKGVVKAPAAVSPIMNLINEFAAWQCQKQPLVSGAERALLLRFCASFNIQTVEDITSDKVAFFIGGELSDFYSYRATIAFRKFLRYARWAGYNAPPTDRHLAEFMTPARPGRPPLTSYAREVQILSHRGKSIRQIKALLEEKYKQPFHISSICRWSKMNLVTA